MDRRRITTSPDDAHSRTAGDRLTGRGFACGTTTLGAPRDAIAVFGAAGDFRGNFIATQGPDDATFSALGIQVPGWARSAERLIAVDQCVQVRELEGARGEAFEDQLVRAAELFGARPGAYLPE
jgi:hypothetical protein